MKLVCVDNCLFKKGDVVYSIPQDEPNSWLNKKYYYFKSGPDDGYWGPKECFIPWNEFRRKKLKKIAYESCLYK